MSEPIVRAAIKTAIQGVTNIGKVYDRPRFVNLWDELIEIFETSGVIRAWTIRISAISQVGLIASGSLATGLKRTYTYIIEGFLSLSDSAASEITATALTIAVMDGLDQANLSVSNVVLVEPAQATLETGGRGSVEVHLITITLTVSEST
jgi:hypothetical protein